jgi:flavin reductase (DIM6/NTAB) family NADH-FMN oxidoreductase RutF
MTANAFTSVSLEPPMILVSVDNRAHMNRLLLVGRPFGVSILAGDQEVLSNHFAGRATEALEIAFVTRHGVSLLDGALAYIVARVVEAHVAGDHTLYIGHVEFLEWREGRPLLFFAGQYGQLEVEKLKRLEWPEDDLLFFSFGSF